MKITPGRAVDVLGSLAEYLLARRAPPFDWMVENVPDGTLRAVWEACRDPAQMLIVAGYGDYQAAVLAACACVRELLKRLPASDPTPRQAIEAFEAYARGTTAHGPLFAAFSALSALRAPPFSPRSAGHDPVHDRAREIIGGLQSGIGDAVEETAQFLGKTDAGTQRVRARFAKRVREMVPCPDLGALVKKS